MKNQHHMAASYFVLTLILLLSTPYARAAIFEEYHTFTDASGRQIKAKVLSYNQDSGAVNLLLLNGKRGAVTTEQVSADDRTYLDRWQAAVPFLSNKLLEINVTFTAGEWVHSGSSNKEHKKKPETYHISMINHGENTLTNLYVEYCQYRNHKTRNAPDKYITADNTSIEIGDLDSGRTFDAHPKHNSYRRGNTFLNEVVGARFRFMMPMPDGTLLMREVCVPEPLPVETYPWQMSEKALEQEKASLPHPMEYPEKALSEQDVELIVQQYIQVWEENDFEAWKAWMSPMHPGSSQLKHYSFQSVKARTKSIKILTIKGRNVKVETTSVSGSESEGWIQLHSSGHIKYTPFVFTHPVYSALVRLPQLVDEDTNDDGVQRIRETKVPLFDYDGGGGLKNWDENTKKTLDWLRKHGASHDISEPKIFLPREKLDQMIRWAETNLEATKQYANTDP